MTDLDWYAVYCHAAKEPLADLNLRRGGYETWFPHEREWQPSEKSKTLSELCKRAYFPRYLFVRAMRGMLSAVNGVIGVSTVVYAPGGEPFPIDAEVMQRLQTELGPSGKVYRDLPPREQFAGVVGQMFRFGEASPFFNFVAQVTCVLDNERVRAKFLEKLFGAPDHEITVSVAQVGELLPPTGSARN